MNMQGVLMKKFFWAAVLMCGTVNFSFAGEAWVRFSDDAQRIVVDAEGIKEFKGVSSAVYELDGKHHRVGTASSAVTL